MNYLSPPTLTQAEQKLILQATATNCRDHTIFSMALGTGLRLAELVGLNVGRSVSTTLRHRPSAFSELPR
jgi:integrase